MPGVRGAQAYLYESADGLVVIDPGYTGSSTAVLRFLDVRGASPSDLTWVILTHHHIDHAGAVLALCAATGAKLAVHRDDAPYLRPGRPRERMTFWGMADWLPQRWQSYVMSCASGDVRLLDDGDSIAGLTVIHAPGHTPGSICLWSPRASALFAGDVLNNEHGLGTPPWTVNHTHRQATAAADRLGDFAFEQAFFGHGPSISEHAGQQVTAFLEHRAGRASRKMVGDDRALSRHSQP